MSPDPQAGATPREIELKLELASGRVEDLLRHPALRAAQPEPAQGGRLRAVYYDTPDQALRRSGLSLRLREHGGRRVQTVKAETGSRGLALDRAEWEVPAAAGIDWEAASRTPLGPLFADPAIRNRLRPAFTVATDRRVLMVPVGDALVEVSVDLAEAKAGNESSRFTEVELELKRGDPSALFALARNLAEAAPLRISTITKSERGYRLLGNAGDAPQRAVPVAIPPETPLAEAFRIMARSCLHQIVRNEAVIRESRDPEAVHQMRVGLRRLNAARFLCGSLLDDRESRAVAKDLRWIGRKLGRVRDLDVSADRLCQAGPKAAKVLAGIEEQRRGAYDSLIHTLEGPRFMRAVLRLAAWVEAGTWVEKSRRNGRQPVATRAAKELGRCWKRIRKRLKAIGTLSAKRRHRLRMRLKRLRYGIEFCAGAFPGPQAAERREVMLSLLEDLQDDLGEMNDIALARERFPVLDDVAPQRTGKRLAKLLSRAEASARRLRKAGPVWEAGTGDGSAAAGERQP